LALSRSLASPARSLVAINFFNTDNILEAIEETKTFLYKLI
jgi:hypothetical protein